MKQEPREEKAQVRLKFQRRKMWKRADWLFVKAVSFPSQAPTRLPFPATPACGQMGRCDQVLPNGMGEEGEFATPRAGC